MSETHTHTHKKNRHIYDTETPSSVISLEDIYLNARFSIHFISVLLITHTLIPVSNLAVKWLKKLPRKHKAMHISIESLKTK